MSTAIVLQDWCFGDDSYEPATDGTRFIRNAWWKEKDFLRGSASDWMPTVEGALSSIRNECCNEGWDGEQASPVSEKTIELTEKICACLFDLLPKGTPAPDVLPEADGEICITWDVDSARTFAVSVGEHEKINFAGQLGRRGGVHAWRPIDSASNSEIAKSLFDVARYIQMLF